MTKLSVLVIRSKLTTVPKLGRSTRLQRFVVRSALDKEFPDSIFGLEQLVWLEFGNQFTRLPDEVLNLKNLVVLDLVSDDLEYLPDDLGKLKKLQHLSLESDKIEELPSTFDQFELMTDLYLWNFPTPEVPKIICKLPNLRYFWMKDNAKLRGRLERVPKEIGQLTTLVDLQLNGHIIQQIPESIGKLKNLETLNFGINNLSSLPKSIIKLKKLKRLELYLNPIEELPENIGDLQQLQYLDISDTKITLLPSDIARIRDLTDFDALGCDLQSLPLSIAGWNYTKIRSFVISLHEDPKMLPQVVQDWIAKLVRYAEEHADKEIQVEISLYEPEHEDKFEE